MLIRFGVAGRNLSSLPQCHLLKTNTVSICFSCFQSFFPLSVDSSSEGFEALWWQALSMLMTKVVPFPQRAYTVLVLSAASTID